ncbi:hypothetical protein [Burkholderia cepacia]|uniref:hypothetical protein n=1 Tax=Burkholderia cepacia TaxID=292 RepID=UPI001F1A8EBB|nr:hypothetical protein [Burkholderia cepacia]MCE4125776.1 hypothetical protein [Burkholderia cepacia]
MNVSKGRAVCEKLPLHPATEYLVMRGMAAVRDKLARAEQKYGYRDGWLSPNWMSECRAKMYHHITKGDPLDVIAYCLFLWHHGAPTCRPGFHVELLDQFDVVLDRRDLRDFARSAIEHALREPLYDGAGVTSTWYLEESTRRAEEFVEKFANRVAPVDEIPADSKVDARDVDGQISVADLIKALFIENPAGELGPSDEPESQYRDGYNTALEDVIAALESPAAANMARAAHAHEYVCDCRAGECAEHLGPQCRAAVKIAGSNGELREQIDRYHAICAAAYQFVGAVDGPLRFLDALSNAANGEPMCADDALAMLPISPIECGAAGAAARESTIAEILCELEGMIAREPHSNPLAPTERNGIIRAFDVISRLDVDTQNKCKCSGLGPCEKRRDGSCRLGQQSVSPQPDPVGEWGELREFVERENAAARERGENADR